MIKLLRSILVLSFTLSLAPAVFAQAKTPATPPTASSSAKDIDLEEEIDFSIHWLRTGQDKSDGSFGGSVEGTAWTLIGLAESPRKYKKTDGPFVTRALEYLASKQQPDGSIHDANATGKDIIRETQLATLALTRFADEAIKPVLAKALAFTGKNEGPSPLEELKVPGSKDEALALASALVAKQTADHSWMGPKGPVIETARNVVLLSLAYPLTETGHAASKEPRPLPGIAEVDHAKVVTALESGGKFLLSKSSAAMLAKKLPPDNPEVLAARGIFDGKPGEHDGGLTAMAIGALQCVPTPRPKEIQDAIDNGLAWLVSLQKPDGSIHNGMLANYVTSASILALTRSGKPEYKPVIEKARNFLVALQADEVEGYSPDHPFYGGNSYGDEQRPDLSNVQSALEALVASGLPKGDKAYERALKFLQRCQNRSESNDIALESDGSTIVSGNDGGSAYTPGNSKAGYDTLPDGRKSPRSYGSMTYALLKSFLICGLPKDDPRMKACWEWLRKNYTLDVNPGFETSQDPAAPYQGLFYYLHTMAKTLALYGEENVVDAQGRSNPWRKQMCGRLISMQRKEDGSWINENSPRWWEGNPVLATTYAMLALDAAMPR